MLIKFLVEMIKFFRKSIVREEEICSIRFGTNLNDVFRSKIYEIATRMRVCIAIVIKGGTHLAHSLIINPKTMDRAQDKRRMV